MSDSACYVYAIKMDGVTGDLEDATKIGLAYVPETRLKELQVGNAIPLSIRKTWGFHNRDLAKRFEAECHRVFKSHHLMGEWFSVTIEMIDGLREQFSAKRERSDIEAVRLLAIMEKKKTQSLEVQKKSGLLDTRLAAEYIGKSTSWLNKSRMSGTGPTYLKLGGGVKYRIEDLDEWLNSWRRTAVYDHAQRTAA